MSELHWFEGFGIELEYMLVDRETLDVHPAADTVLAELWQSSQDTDSDTDWNAHPSDFEFRETTWSNELALHVLELKTTQPATAFDRVASEFEASVAAVQSTLKSQGIRLLPTAMHPWMKPAKQTQLWPHEYHEIYNTYHRIFNCHRHGWSNVQSMHLNLPFRGNDEFAGLHAAVRLLLPLLPAIAASSPIVEGVSNGCHDNRLRFYVHHCDTVPSMMGDVIPEPIFDRSSYQTQILDPIADDIALLDPLSVMNSDFLNARGAIARFDRGSIEIRLLDVQETPGVDIAIAGLVTHVAKRLAEQTWSSRWQQQLVSCRRLGTILDDTTVSAEATIVSDADFLVHFGITQSSCTAAEIWQHLIDDAYRFGSGLDGVAAPLEIIQQRGTLSTRILQSLGSKFTNADLHGVYEELADCLERNEIYQP